MSMSVLMVIGTRGDVLILNPTQIRICSSTQPTQSIVCSAIQSLISVQFSHIVLVISLSFSCSTIQLKVLLISKIVCVQLYTAIQSRIQLSAFNRLSGPVQPNPVIDQQGELMERRKELESELRMHLVNLENARRDHHGPSSSGPDMMEGDDEEDQSRHR